MQMAFSDSLRDSELSKKDFVTFLYRLGYRLYGNGTRPNFGALPADLQALFSQFAHTNSDGIPVIDVTGYRPGDAAAVSQQQLDRLWELCYSTTQTFLPDYDFIACKNFLALSDVKGEDDSLTIPEYLNFIAQMSNDRLPIDEPYGPYLGAVRGVFISVSVGDGISVNGTKTGQIPTAEQDAYLAEVCSATSNLVAFILKSRLPGEDGSPTFPWCFETMDAVDASRDGTLNRSEYVTFVNNAFDVPGDDFARFDSLPQPLQDNFAQAANDTSVDGVTPVIKLISQFSTMEELLVLHEKCHNTWKAFQSWSYSLEKNVTADEENIAPSPDDGLSQGIGVDGGERDEENSNGGIFAVYNAFYIANFVDLKQDNFRVGVDRRGLDEGYAAFVHATVLEFIAQQTWRRLGGELVRSNKQQRQTKRRLLVTQLSQTKPPRIDDIVDSDCPDTVDATMGTCQIVYGTFHVNHDENEPDPASKQVSLQEWTQSSIMGFAGMPDGLTGFIRQANPTSRIHAVGAAQPPALPGKEDQVALAPSSETKSSGGSNKSGIVSSAVAVLVGALLLCGL